MEGINLTTIDYVFFGLGIGGLLFMVFHALFIRG